MVTGNFKNEISTYIKFVVKKQGDLSFSGMKVYPIWTKLFKGNERENMRSRSVKVLVTQLCPTLCNPMDCSQPGSSDHGIFQARILEWVAMPTSRGSCRPRDQTWASCLGSPALQADSLPFGPPSFQTQRVMCWLHLKPYIQIFTMS